MVVISVLMLNGIVFWILLVSTAIKAGEKVDFITFVRAQLERYI